LLEDCRHIGHPGENPTAVGGVQAVWFQGKFLHTPNAGFNVVEAQALGRSRECMDTGAAFVNSKDLAS
jgi:hypothetical protein